jgi:putative nucleotidyltransferase with HDIG domain
MSKAKKTLKRLPGVPSVFYFPIKVYLTNNEQRTTNNEQRTTNNEQRTTTADKSDLGVFAGYFILTSLIIGVFIFYLRLFALEIFSRFNKLLFILMWLVVYSYLVFVVEKADILSAYLIPFCIVPIVIKTFYNARLALFTHIVVVLIASFLSSLGYEFTFLQILAGIVVLLSDVDTRDWSRFFSSMLYIFFTYALAYFGLSLIEEGKVSTIDWTVYTWIFLNVFLTLLAYPLIPLLERLFGFTSSISLVELSDMNRPLLRELAIKAPGTLQHSLQVANLSEVAARRIGADPLLVKVAALYHDIGKTKQPSFFIENQSGKNPHEGLSYLESAKIIIGHVAEGVKMARKHRLPPVLTKFIETHHGTTRTEYFYRSYMKENPDTAVDESLFRYPGPRPRTKEETILMMADSIEAACKSLKNPTGEELNNFIDKIIEGKITHGQFENSTMSFQELEQCKQEFKSIMRSIYHVRIEYPDDKTAKSEE